MQRYRNYSGTSGIRFFEVGTDSIVLQYRGNDLYLYTYECVGKENVEEMKRLAIQGSHLNKFINEHPEIRRGFVKVKPPAAGRNEEGTDENRLSLKFGS